MRRVASVALVVAAVLWVRHIGPAGATEPSSTALALGFALVAAMVTGDLLRRFRLPRLTGYLLFGVLFGPYLGNVISEPMARQLQLVNGLATTLIAFIAGLAINLERLGPRLAGIAKVTAVTLGIALVGLFAVAWIAWPWLSVAPQATGLAKLTMILLLILIVVSFSPTMTAAVISETGARGHLSDLVLAMVVLADVVVLVLFSLLMQGARFTLLAGNANDVNVLVRLAWEIGGAVAFGSLVGALFALYLRYVARETTIVLIAVCAVLSQVGAAQRFEPLLAAMASGLVIENFAVAQGEGLKMALQRGALPVLVVFFVAVGTSLRLDALVTMDVVATGLVALRIALIRLGLAVGLRMSDVDRRTGAYAWTGLISQAGITLGLASVLATEFPTWGGQVQILVVALIAIDELVGPTIFRTGLAYAGEIDASAPRPLVVVSNREPYLHHYDADGDIVCAPATGGVAVALDALMRERSGVWIAHGGYGRPRACGRHRQAPGPARDTRVSVAAVVARPRRVRRVLRRIRQRRPVAALPPGRCTAQISIRRLGGLSGGQRPLRGRDRARAADGRDARVHPGLPSGARRGATPRTATGGRRTSSRASRVSGRNRCNMPRARRRTRPYETSRACLLACDAIIYIGDDDTDEDAFRSATPDRLLAIRIGAKRRSRAHHWLKSQAEVDAFLQALLSLRPSRYRRQAAATASSR